MITLMNNVKVVIIVVLLVLLHLLVLLVVQELIGRLDQTITVNVLIAFIS